MAQHLPYLRGDGVAIREPMRDDAETLFGWSGEAGVERWNPFDTPQNVADVRRMIDQFREYRATDLMYVFAIEDGRSGEVAGLTWLSAMVPPHRAEMGTWLGRSYWGTGIYRESKRLILPFAFDAIGVRRVEARIAKANVRAQRAFAALGAVREGVLRDGWVLRDGRVVDQYLYTLLAKDYWEKFPNEKAKLRAMRDESE